MKFAMIFLVAVAAVAPPRISLNLEGMTSAYKLKDSIIRSHDLKYTQNDNTAVVSRQDWTEKCPALRSCPKGKTCEEGGYVYTGRENCPFPVAKGYDHQDKQVDVTTRIYLVDKNGAPVENMKVQTVDFKERATYLFKYDASDKAGNHAEQVVFALILDDTQAPMFRANCQKDIPFRSAITVEAVSDWRLCQLRAFDNVDKNNVGAITYKIDYLNRNHEVFTRREKQEKEEVQSGLQPGSSYTDAAKYFNPNGNGVEMVGKYLVTASVTDHAGVYGHNAENNLRTLQQAILVRDTVAPTIFLGGSDPTFVECSIHKFDNKYKYKAYRGYKSTCKDKLDTAALGLFLRTTTTLGENGPTFPGPTDATEHNDQKFFDHNLANKLSTVGDYKLYYSCNDYAGNAATKKSRRVKTVDTESPTLLLKSKDEKLGGDTHVVKYRLNADIKNHAVRRSVACGRKGDCPNFQDDGAWAKDSCDKTVNTKSIEMSWGPRPFNARQLGDYVRTYTVKDVSGNKATKTRTFTVIDEDVPEISRMGNEVETYQASRDTEYTDKGATCHDFVDGELSHAVEVSGEVVNMRIPGTYAIQYDCQDLSGNEATTQKRTVVIQDTKKPVLKLLGAKINYVEAGFPYIDGGATATDSLDGDITQYIWTDGNTVNFKNAWYSKRSCQEILDGWKQENKHELRSGKKYPGNGEYYITVQVNNNFKRQAVHCIFNKQWKGTALTYKIHHEGDRDNCKKIGMVKLRTINWKTKIEGTGYRVRQEIKRYINVVEDHNLIGNLDEYVCVPNVVAAPVAPRRWQSQTPAHQIQDAEQGKYVIQFHVEDKAGNHAKIVKRTVIVKDTLPPVITLHLNKKLIHTSDHSQFGINHDKISGIHKAGSNPQPNTKGWNPYKQNSDGTIGGEYMAESATTNGWLIGAVASAVAGVALLGLSAKKTATSVPV